MARLTTWWWVALAHWRNGIDSYSHAAFAFPVLVIDVLPYRHVGRCSFIIPTSWTAAQELFFSSCHSVTEDAIGDTISIAAHFLLWRCYVCCFNFCYLCAMEWEVLFLFALPLVECAESMRLCDECADDLFRMRVCDECADDLCACACVYILIRWASDKISRSCLIPLAVFA